jgi:glycosyltransferase involved in cell wall biosynthesis
MTMARLSIIIPTMNEAATLARTLRHVKALHPPAWEVLVVDGGSSDRTLQIAAEAGVVVLRGEQASRAIQMNQGARQATGDLLCFLHADTLIPDDPGLIQSISRYSLPAAALPSPAAP